MLRKAADVPKCLLLVDLVQFLGNILLTVLEGSWRVCILSYIMIAAKKNKKYADCGRKKE